MTILKEEEEIIKDVIISARKIQEFLWGDMNDGAGFEEYKRMLRKRLSKIEKIDLSNPHWKIELKKRLLQITGISVQMIYKLTNNLLKDGIHPSLPSNLSEYVEIVNFLECGLKDCVKYPHEMKDNMHHVPCAMCGLPRPYIETEDWRQTQKEMGEMCGWCLEEACGDK